MGCDASAVDWQTLATLDELQSARTLVRSAGGQEILLVRSGGGVVAVSNRCTHLGKPLECGRVMGGQITCPFHGACFDLKSGRAVSGPAVFPLKVFPTQLVGNQIQVCVEP